MSEVPEHARFYRRACKTVNRLLGPRIHLKSGRTDQLKIALRSLGLDLEPHEVAFFAGFVAIVCLVIGLVFLIIAALASMETIVIIMMAPAILVTPIAAYLILEAHPMVLAKRVKVLSLARAPEAINYMVMSMRLSPSITRAIEFASDNTEEPISSELKKVLWDIYMRKHDNVEEAFLNFAYNWSDMEDFKRALYAIRSSALERTEEGMTRSLDKATETVLSGTKRRVETFVSTLATPTTVLFSLGILLPLIIGAMLPMLSLGSMNADFGAEGAEADSQATGHLWIVFLMDVIFPVVGATYAYHVLGNRPGTTIPLHERTGMRDESVRNLRIVAFSAGAVAVITGIAVLAATRHIIGSFLIIWGAGMSISLYYFAMVRGNRRAIKNIRKMEEEFPDALFQLGSRIAEGNPVEHALKTTSETMKGSEIGKLLEKISFQIQISRTTLEEALFGQDGMLSEFPSSTIRATMKILVEVAKKDAHAAGQTMISISTYLRDMKNIEHQIKTSLRSSVESMKATGIIFAPLVMGVTSALYFLLFGVFGGLGGGVTGGLSGGLAGGSAGGLGGGFGTGTGMMAPSLFVLVIGVYLLLTVMIIMYFCTGIEHGADPVERKYQTAVAIPVALLVFTVATMVGPAT
jgi:Flp pilus assembly protein TadB